MIFFSFTTHCLLMGKFLPTRLLFGTILTYLPTWHHFTLILCLFLPYYFHFSCFIYRIDVFIDLNSSIYGLGHCVIEIVCIHDKGTKCSVYLRSYRSFSSEGSKLSLYGFYLEMIERTLLLHSNISYPVHYRAALNWKEKGTKLSLPAFLNAKKYDLKNIENFKTISLKIKFSSFPKFKLRELPYLGYFSTKRLKFGLV